MKTTSKVWCLEQEFSSEEERREYYRNELRSKLPELKKIEGFPIGEDEDIINLSDPPYYTACPNPWLNDFIAEWEKEKENIKGRKKNFEVNEPYATDISEGRSNPIYNAHSYHTKVPHPAIMRYILHYTQPGDIIFDGFAGTGMTGVAAQICENPDSQTQHKIQIDFKKNGLVEPSWGNRRAICGDLSPIASLIANNYNSPVSVINFQKEALEVLKKVEKEFEWVYETKDINGIGKINYIIWSEVFLCPNCNNDITFYETAIDHNLGKIQEEFSCPNCKSVLTKKMLSKNSVTTYDNALQESIIQNKCIPVLINYTRNGKRFEKKPEKSDFDLIKKIEEFTIPYWFPIDRMPEGDESRRNDKTGITYVHHFYTKRNLLINAAIQHYALESKFPLQILLLKTSYDLTHSTKMTRIIFKNGSKPVLTGYQSGTLYISSLPIEKNVINGNLDKLSEFCKAFSLLKKQQIITVGSAHKTSIKANSVDYIFTDPPFGANLMYSELNFLWESWLKIKTNNKSEAIENKTQGKSLLDYQNLMTLCFEEYYRLLKPSKWMTVEFSNTSAAVWNGIQTALQKVGFIIANVSALDKQQGSFKSVNTATAVKQDLVISCYKPSNEFENKFKTQNGEIAIWDFVFEHLLHLPVHISIQNKTTSIIERSPKILYDRLITFYLMRGLPVPIDARDFQDGLKQKFIERDGMYFTSEQAAEYDEKKAKSPKFVQLSFLVTSENEGVEWLRNELSNPQTAADLHPKWLQAIAAVRKNDIMPELKDLLELNFIKDNNGKWHVPDLNEAKVREAIRTKVLIKEFAAYVIAINQPKAKKLKEVRVEALRAGFKNSWEQKDFKTIVTLGDMIPQNILLEDEQLLMYYDIAKDRL